MESKWKKFAKSAGSAVLSYVVISLLVAVLAVIRMSLPEGEEGGVTWWEILQFLVIPVLFYGLGYLLTDKFGFGKIKWYGVLIGSVVFSGVLFAMWYVLLDAYVLLNLPAAEGSYAIDLWLRKILIVKDYVYLYLAETDAYRYVILPLLHFLFRILYWLLYFLGNRRCIRKSELQGNGKR